MNDTQSLIAPPQAINVKRITLIGLGILTSLTLSTGYIALSPQVEAAIAEETNQQLTGEDGNVSWKYDTTTKTLTFTPKADSDGKMGTHGIFDETPSWKDTSKCPWIKDCQTIEFKSTGNGSDAKFCILQPKSTSNLFSIANFDDSPKNYPFESVSKVDLTGAKLDNDGDEFSFMYMFAGLKNLTSIVGLDTFDTSKVNDFSYMFRNCEKLKTIDLSKFNTAQATDMRSMFSGCKSLENLDLSSFNVEKAENLRAMFYECTSLKSITGIEKFKTSAAEEIDCMFQNCSALESLDLSKFDTKNVTNMGAMFAGCKKLKTITGIDKFNTEKVKTKQTQQTNQDDAAGFDKIFSGCESLEELDLSGWKTSNANYMVGLFDGCKNLKTLNLGTTDNFATKQAVTGQKVENMFRNCNNLQKLTVGKSFVFTNTCGLRDTTWKKDGTDQPTWTTKQLIGTQDGAASIYDGDATKDTAEKVGPGTLVLAATTPNPNPVKPNPQDPQAPTPANPTDPSTPVTPSDPSTTKPSNTTTPSGFGLPVEGSNTGSTSAQTNQATHETPAATPAAPQAPSTPSASTEAGPAHVNPQASAQSEEAHTASKSRAALPQTSDPYVPAGILSFVMGGMATVIARTIKKQKRTK